MPCIFKARGAVSSYSHFIGGFSWRRIVCAAPQHKLSDSSVTGSLWRRLPWCSALSLIALYSASSVYHFRLGGGSQNLVAAEKLDHSMIYVLIAAAIRRLFLKPCLRRAVMSFSA